MCLLSSAICLQIYEVLGVFKSILHKAHSALMTTNTLSIWLNPWVGICPVTVWTFSRSPHKVGKRVHHLWGPDSFMCGHAATTHHNSVWIHPPARAECTAPTVPTEHQVSSRSPVESSRSVFISRQHWGLDARVSRMLAKCPATELQPQAQLYFNIGCNSALREKG